MENFGDESDYDLKSRGQLPSLRQTQRPHVWETPFFNIYSIITFINSVQCR